MDHSSSEADQSRQPGPPRQPRQPKPQKEHITWLRSQVLDLSSQGRTEKEIATMLRIGAATVARDLSYLNKQARESLQVHISERLPEQYQKCHNGLTQVLKMAWNIVLIDSVNQSNKLQALSLISDCYKYQTDLSTNGVIVNDAPRIVQSKMEHLKGEEKRLLRDIKRVEDMENNEHVIDVNLSQEKEEEQLKTTNGVF
jgi:hypothetical protein